MSTDLTPLIQSHFLNGIPATELTEYKNEQKRLNDLFKLFDMYNENPCMDVASALRWKFHHSPKQITEDMVYFKFIQTNFCRMTRQKAQDIVNWTAEKVIRDAAAVNDRKGMLDGAKVLGKYMQLDKPEPEKDDKVIRPLEVVYTPYVEILDPDRQTIEDKKLLGIMKEFDAHIDVQEERIAEKLEELKGEGQVKSLEFRD